MQKAHTHTKRDIKNKFVHLWTECPANRTNSVPRTMNFYWNIDAEKTENIFLSIFCLLLVLSSGLRWNIKPFGYSIFFFRIHISVLCTSADWWKIIWRCVSRSRLNCIDHIMAWCMEKEMENSLVFPLSFNFEIKWKNTERSHVDSW